jgi:predicted phage terminase large subunit-like protein
MAGLTATERKRLQRQRDRLKKLGASPEEIAAVNEKAQKIKETKAEIERQYQEDLAWAHAQDATGKYYKAECRSAEQLLAIYHGNNTGVVEVDEDYDEDDEEAEALESAKKNKKIQQNMPNPSAQPIRILASETYEDGQLIKFDPDNEKYRGLCEVSEVVSFQEWLDLRDKGRKDLFWLSGLLEKRLFHKTHQVICDQFVQKDFTGKYFDGYDRHTVSAAIRDQKRFAADGQPTRTAMIFAPRGGWKSTIDGVDAVQWMLNAPDVRIMIITAFRTLSKMFLKEIKEYFYLSPRGEPSAFQLLYPEYVVTGRNGTSKEPLICPAARLKSKEPHLWVTSMESSITGQRCDICKADDIVDPKNSTDEVMRQALVDKFNGALNLTEPWGFIDIIGTRYFTDDYYGTRMSADDDGIVAPYSVLSISAWTPKSGFEVAYQLLLQEPNGMSLVTEDMVDLWFPFKLDFATLRRKLTETKERKTTNIQKERNFRNQYLNIATDPLEVNDFTVHFDRQTLRDHTYAASAAPVTGEIFVCIDWAYSDGKASDYSALVAVRRHCRPDGTYELIVLEVLYGKWKSDLLAEKIVLFLRKHQPTRTFIEKALGHDLLHSRIVWNAGRYGVNLQGVDYVPTGNSKNEKSNRIKTLEILLASDRLHFVAGPWIDETYKQFENFTGETKKGRKDDIPDAISRASKTLPQDMFSEIVGTLDVEDKRQTEEQIKQLRKAQHYQQYFGNRYSGTIKHPAAPSLFAPTWRQWANGGNQSTPPTITEVAPAKPQDARLKLFGGRGPWRM